jgi:hypothetical protein
VHAAEEHPGLAAPGSIANLSTVATTKARQLAVDLLVDEEHREAVAVVPAREGAVRVDAADAHLLGFGDLGPEGERVGGDLAGAPGALGEGEGAAGFAAVAVVGDLGGDVGEGVGGGAAADPEADGEALGAELVGASLAQQLQGADQRGGAAELVEGEQAQGVAQQHGDAEARVGAPAPAAGAERG